MGLRVGSARTPVFVQVVLPLNFPVSNMWLWRPSFCSPLSVTSGAGGFCTQVAAGGWELRGVSALPCETTLLLRPAYLQSLDCLKRKCEEGTKWLGTTIWGRADGLKRRGWAGAEDAAVALAATIPVAQVWAATGQLPSWGSTITLIAPLQIVLKVYVWQGVRWGREDESTAAPLAG